MMTSFYRSLRLFPIYSPIMTSSPKMLTSAEKNRPGSNFCPYPIKDILNKYQTKFGYKPIKNRENGVGRLTPPPPPPHTASK